MLEHRDTQEVKDTILRYNKLLTGGYSKMNMTPLREVATLEQSIRVYDHMAALGEAGIRMESQLVDIKFLDINIINLSINHTVKDGIIPILELIQKCLARIL